MYVWCGLMHPLCLHLTSGKCGESERSHQWLSCAKCDQRLGAFLCFQHLLDDTLMFHPPNPCALAPDVRAFFLKEVKLNAVIRVEPNPTELVSHRGGRGLVMELAEPLPGQCEALGSSPSGTCAGQVHTGAG